MSPVTAACSAVICYRACRPWVTGELESARYAHCMVTARELSLARHSVYLQLNLLASIPHTPSVLLPLPSQSAVLSGSCAFMLLARHARSRFLRSHGVSLEACLCPDAPLLGYHLSARHIHACHSHVVIPSSALWLMY